MGRGLCVRVGVERPPGDRRSVHRGRQVLRQAPVRTVDRAGHHRRGVASAQGRTGAVGGTALLEMLALYEQMFAIHPPGPEDVPVLVSTGTTSDEIAAFTRRLFRFVESRHGPGAVPARVRHGYLTHSGVFVAMER